MKAVIALLALSLPFVPDQIVSKSELDLAVTRVERFAPERFARLPPSARDAFNAMACRVPQTTVAGAPANLIAGEFAAKGQRDWAALCSDGSTTQIRIVWGGPERCEDAVAARQDSDSMVAPAPGVITYGRSIGVASPEHISRYLLRHGAALPESPAHDAIEDTFARAGLVYYCYGRHWLMIPGEN